MRIRVPDSFDLALEPQLGPLVQLEVAAVLAINALRAHHVQILGDAFPGELDEPSMARDLVAECHRVLALIRIYRARVRVRLERDHAGRFDSDDE